MFHGHEPLDTDATPDLEGECWLMHKGCAQAEGVAHLDLVPPTGCLVSIGCPKFEGGVGGYPKSRRIPLRGSAGLPRGRRAG